MPAGRLDSMVFSDVMSTDGSRENSGHSSSCIMDGEVRLQRETVSFRSNRVPEDCVYMSGKASTKKVHRATEPLLARKRRNRHGSTAGWGGVGGVTQKNYVQSLRLHVLSVRLMTFYGGGSFGSFPAASKDDVKMMIRPGDSEMHQEFAQSFRRLHSTSRQLPDNALFLPEASAEDDLLKDALLGADRDTCGGAASCFTSSSSSSCVSSPRHSWVAPERKEPCSFGRPPPQKPLPCSLADVQEAMESSTGVLRIAPPQRDVPVGDGGEEEDGDDAVCTLPRGAEPLFWSRGRGLYFLRQLGTAGLQEGEAGEAGYWVAASEEEYRGYVVSYWGFRRTDACTR